MFSHVTVGTNDLERSTAFYEAVLTRLGLQQRAVVPDGGPPSACWSSPGATLPRFYVYSPFNQRPAAGGNGNMVAFLAPSHEAVDAAYAAGILSGGVDEGEPGSRAHYGAGYYGAYLRDPDGNKIHLVHRGDLTDA